MSLRESDRIWNWVFLAIALHFLAVFLWYDVATKKTSLGETPERVSVRMSIQKPVPIQPPALLVPTPTPPEVKSRPKTEPRPSPSAKPPPEVAPAPIDPSPILEPIEQAIATQTTSQPVSESTERENETEDYVSKIRAMVEAVKRYPSMARRRSIEGIVLTRFQIENSGAVVNITTDNASASLLNRSARDAVKRAGPFPPPPNGTIWIEIPIRYSLMD